MFQTRFTVKSVKKLCKKLITECVGCQRGSDYRPKHAPKGHIESNSPWEVLSFVIMVPLPPTHTDKRFIASIIDCFSKYITLEPTGSHNAISVSMIIYQRVVAYFGIPNKIISDRGTEFTGADWKQLMKILGAQ